METKNRFLRDSHYFRLDDERPIPTLYKEMTHLRHTIGGKLSERLIPLRWHSFHDYEGSTVIEAVLDRPVGGFVGMSVLFDYAKDASSVELIREDDSTLHHSWDRSPYLRAELFKALKVLRAFIPNHGYLRVWKSWEKNFEMMETL